MLVSKGRGRSHFREDHSGILTINGHFVDIFFEEDGVRKFVGVLKKDLVELLKDQRHGNSVHTVVTVDRPADAETALKDFLKRTSVRDLLKDV